MRTYIRSHATGGTYFFTVNLAQRKNNDLLVRHIDELRYACHYTKQRHPMDIEAMVVLPEHLHCIWLLPEGDDDYPMRWRLLKSHFSRQIQKNEFVSDSRLRKNERGVWQRRYWEHQIRDETDYQRHLDYIHYNPVKHGYVDKAVDWRYSSIHRWIKLGIYTENWAALPELIEQNWE